MALLTINAPKVPSKSTDDRSNHRHRIYIGLIAIMFPTLITLIVLSRDGLAVWNELDSISAYYYTGANPVFVGMLFVLGLFLLAYEGYKNKYAKYDRWCARIAAGAALFVAFFPTAAPDVEVIAPLAWWAPWMGVVHFSAAVVLFLTFAVYCLFLFPLTEKDIGNLSPWKLMKRWVGLTDSVDEKDPWKNWLNRLYFLCGLAIVTSIAWAGFNAWSSKPIFQPECTALIAFALSWLGKGRFFERATLAELARSSLAPNPDAVEETEKASH
jgi:hypothetical protein